MPKIIKNGKEYSGVPIEVVTAWAPTADPVQVKEPLMGNTDISAIGDGSITGAIDTINDGLTNKIGMVTVNIAGVEINLQDSGWYYKQVNVPNLPEGAICFGVSTGNYDANVIPVLYGNILTLRCPVTKTITTSGSRLVYVYYYLP